MHAMHSARWPCALVCHRPHTVTANTQAFATLRGWLQLHTQQPKNSQPERAAHSTSSHREGAHGLYAPGFPLRTPYLQRTYPGGGAAVRLRVGSVGCFW